MSRELRANLIFFVILLLLIAPGFFILMRKKLTGSDRPNYLPDPVPHVAAYIQPDPVRPGLPRMEPQDVRQWVADQWRQHGGDTVFRGAGDTPVVSSNHRSQLLAFDRSGTHQRVALLVWDERDLAHHEPAVVLHTATGSHPADGTDNTPIDVPRHVRHSLQEAGYVDPPDRVWLVQRTAPLPHERVDTLTLQFADSGMPDQTFTLGH